MAITTFAAFVGTLTDLDVAGVATHLDEPPVSLEACLLPAQWVQQPQAVEDMGVTFGNHGGWPRFTAQLVIAYGSVAQSDQANNWKATLTQLDTVLTSLRGASIGRGKLTWTIRPGITQVGGNDYWSVIAEVSANG